MFKYILPSLRGYKKSYLRRDILAGIVVAALTIPVAMGYAQVAGLPPIYGLYASILPVIGYALFASSPQLIFGMDASASAITGSVIAGIVLAGGSATAIEVAPVLAFSTAVFLLLFAIFRLGRFAAYLSTPVMSGFISGIAISIIVGQIPKMMGVTAQGTDFFGNIGSIIGNFSQTSWLSLIIGIIAAVLVILGKKFFPKIPAALVVLVLATILSAIFHFSDFGVAIIGEIPTGLPRLAWPDVFSPHIQEAFTVGFVIAIVVFADSLLSSNSFALRGRYKINDNQELYAFAASNFFASLTGTSPTSASVSRTAASEQFKGKTQLVSIVAALLIAIIVLFLGPLLYNMPQPVLAGIIVAAIVGVVEIGYAKKLFGRTRTEFSIWLASAIGVLLVGILFGVIIGVILSFIDFIRRSTAPPQAFLGKIPGHKGYYDLKRHPDAKPLDDIVIYRFSSALFFANIQLFEKSVSRIITKQKPRALILDASGVTSIDSTAAAELKAIIQSLDASGIPYFFTGAIGRLDDELTKFGLKQSGSEHNIKTIDTAVIQAKKAISKTKEDK